LRKIANAIFHYTDQIQHRPDQHVQFTEALLQRLLKPGFHVERQDVEGVDYQRDKIHLTAGSVKVEIDHPYWAFTSAKVWIGTKPWPIELGFNDGTRHGAAPSLDEAYASMMRMVLFVRAYERLEWPDDLHPQFVSDIQQAFRTN
jgi:hypothetical protein